MRLPFSRIISTPSRSTSRFTARFRRAPPPLGSRESSTTKIFVSRPSCGAASRMSALRPQQMKRSSKKERLCCSRRDGSGRCCFNSPGHSATRRKTAIMSSGCARTIFGVPAGARSPPCELERTRHSGSARAARPRVVQYRSTAVQKIRETERRSRPPRSDMCACMAVTIRAGLRKTSTSASDTITCIPWRSSIPVARSHQSCGARGEGHLRQLRITITSGKL